MGLYHQHCKELKNGDQINIGPNGNGFLILNEIPEVENIWMLATGTGIGPYLSILRTEESWNKFKKVVLVHAVRYANELTYQKTISELKDKYGERFIYVTYVSREDTQIHLKEEFLKVLLVAHFKQKTGIEILPSNSHVMLCGNPDMVKDTTIQLKNIGLKKHRRSSPGHITTENYW